LVQITNQNPQGGDAIDDQIPRIWPTLPSPLGDNIAMCIITPIWLFKS
jgi:hypothetical protein